MLKPGDFVTAIEGVDLGSSGAYVIEVDGNEVSLALVDNEEVVKVEIDEDTDYSVDSDREEEGVPENSYYDESAIDSPSLQNIRTQPLWWGPRDPNSPSSMTRVIWQPEPYWLRQIHRHYGSKDMAQDGKLKKGDAGYEPVPQTPERHNNVQTDQGLPRRMRLDQWESSDDDVLDAETLRDLSTEFWKSYRDKRYTYMPDRGNRNSLHAYDYGLMFMADMDLSRKEMKLLFSFMAKTGLCSKNEELMFLDTLDTYQVFWRNKNSN